MAYYFDGTDKVLYNNSSAILSATPGTMIAWVYASDLSAIRGVINAYYSGANDYFDFYVDTDGTPVANHRSSTTGNAFAGASTTINTGAWYMLHARFSTTSARYAGIGGTNEGSETSTTVTFANTPNRFAIGQRYGAGGDHRFYGYISMVALYNANLSGSDLAELATKAPNDAACYTNCVAYYDFRTNDANILKNQKNPGTYDLSNYGTVAYSSAVGEPTFTVKYLRLLAHPTAASASSIEGVVLNAARDTVIGEFSTQAFEASLDGTTGAAELLIPTSEITPDGATLTTSDAPLAVAYNANFTTGLVTCTVVEQ